MLGYSGEQQLGYREFTSMNEQRKLSRKQWINLLLAHIANVLEIKQLG